MRRPTKELVDAVVPDGRRSTSGKPDEPNALPTTVEKEKANLRAVVIKRDGDEGDGSAWKSLPSAAGGSAGAADDVGEPNSPLSKKTARQGQGQGQSQAQDEAPAGPPTLNSSAAANAISALISASATSRRRPIAQASNPELEKRPVPPEPLGERKEREKEKESHLAVFDFTDSSPPDTASGRPRVDLAKQARAGRRYSSVPASAAGALPAVSARQGAGVRSVSAVGVAATREREREKGSREVKQAKSSAPLRSGSSSSTVNSGAGDESGGEKGNGRGESAAARRRSMML